MAKKKPRPIGAGNWVQCVDCSGTGQVRVMKRTLMSKLPRVKEALAGYPCETCKATGWLESH